MAYTMEPFKLICPKCNQPVERTTDTSIAPDEEHPFAHEIWRCKTHGELSEALRKR